MTSGGIMSHYAQILGALGITVLSSCQAWPTYREDAAVIVSPSVASRAELLRVVREALHGVPVALADDALTTSSTLAIEHARPLDTEGRLMNGRELQMPTRFDLVKRGSHCVLIESQTARRWTLKNTQCVAQMRQDRIITP